MNTVKDNFVFSSGIYQHYPMLRRARELGLRVHCLDADQDFSEEEIEKADKAGKYSEWKQQKEAERDQHMFESTKKVVTDGKRKMLILVGSAHLAKGALPHKNLGDLLSENAAVVKSSRVTLDRDFDADVTMQDTKQVIKGKLGHDINLNSVFYTVLSKHGFGKIGFDLDNSVLTATSRQSEFPFDGYVKL